jgi:putative tricarboxylic transport membrane protein
VDLLNGIISCLQPANLLYCFIGCFLGTLVGVLPGLGPAATLAILLPLTTFLDPTGSIIMLGGIYYGAMYGGSTTSILVNIPGEASSVATALDGFQMTKQGRAGEALWIAAVGSFIAGTAGALAISFLGATLARHALKFGPPEYFGLLLFCLTAVISLSGASLIKGVGAALVGLILAAVGIDQTTGVQRFDFGFVGLTRGLDLVSLTVGLFGIAEVLNSVSEKVGQIYEGKLGKMMPRGKELKKGILAAVRGTLLGFPLGILPGMVPALTSFLAYDLERRVSKNPDQFGKGAIEGVAGPESANNATSMAGFFPLMVLGIPTGPAMAVMLAALVLYGLQPGPMLFDTNKDFVWTVIGSFYVGNVMLLILNLPLVGLWARLSLVPYKYLGPCILAICVVGAYCNRNVMFDVWFALGAGIVGFAMKKFRWPIAPLILGFILGPMTEASFRQALMMDGPMIFFTRPIPVIFFALTVVTLIVSMMYLKRHVPKEILEDDSDK